MTIIVNQYLREETFQYKDRITNWELADGGKRYLTSEANQDVLTQALQSGTAKWYWNKTLFKKCGSKDSAQLHAYIVDKEGKRIPDLHLEINRSIN